VTRGPLTEWRPNEPPTGEARQQQQQQQHNKEDGMGDLQAVADRVEIEALRGEFTDAVMMRDYDRLAWLFTQDGVVRMPHINAEATSRRDIRAGIERMQGLWDYFVQTIHPGTIELDGDTAAGRAYVSELMHGGGSSHLNYAVYHDRYQRTPDGWKFAERVYEVRYVDTTPLAGSAPQAGASPLMATATATAEQAITPRARSGVR
jgi:ketosteroid isomerase-like protein